MTQILLIYFNRHVPSYIQTLPVLAKNAKELLFVNLKIPELLPQYHQHRVHLKSL